MFHFHGIPIGSRIGFPQLPPELAVNPGHFDNNYLARETPAPSAGNDSRTMPAFPTMYISPEKRAFNKKVSEKIRRIEHEGLRGKKVSHKQAQAAAFDMVRSGKYARQNPIISATKHLSRGDNRMQEFAARGRKEMRKHNKPMGKIDNSWRAYKMNYAEPEYYQNEYGVLVPYSVDDASGNVAMGRKELDDERKFLRERQHQKKHYARYAYYDDEDGEDPEFHRQQAQDHAQLHAHHRRLSDQLRQDGQHDLADAHHHLSQAHGSRARRHHQESQQQAEYAMYAEERRPAMYGHTAICGRCGQKWYIPDQEIDMFCPRCGASATKYARYAKFDQPGIYDHEYMPMHPARRQAATARIKARPVVRPLDDLYESHGGRKIREHPVPHPQFRGEVHIREDDRRGGMPPSRYAHETVYGRLERLKEHLVRLRQPTPYSSTSYAPRLKKVPKIRADVMTGGGMRAAAKAMGNRSFVSSNIPRREQRPKFEHHGPTPEAVRAHGGEIIQSGPDSFHVRTPQGLKRIPRPQMAKGKIHPDVIAGLHTGPYGPSANARGYAPARYREFDTAERRHDVKTGAAMRPLKGEHGGRYPIENATDLRNAARAIGRTSPAKRPAVRRHIAERAHALGLRNPQAGKATRQ